MLPFTISERCVYRVVLSLVVCGRPLAAMADESTWKKHVVHTGLHTSTAIGGDYTKDGRTDVISNSGGKTRLFVAPEWKEVILDETPNYDFIHSETFDVDGD